MINNQYFIKNPDFHFYLKDLGFKPSALSFFRIFAAPK